MIDRAELELLASGAAPLTPRECIERAERAAMALDVSALDHGCPLASRNLRTASCGVGRWRLTAIRGESASAGSARGERPAPDLIACWRLARGACIAARSGVSATEVTLATVSTSPAGPVRSSANVPGWRDPFVAQGLPSRRAGRPLAQGATVRV